MRPALLAAVRPMILTLLAVALLSALTGRTLANFGEDGPRVRDLMFFCWMLSFALATAIVAMPSP